MPRPWVPRVGSSAFYVMLALNERCLRTASEIHAAMSFATKMKNEALQTRLKSPSLATVSSLLNKLTKSGDVVRVYGVGPRGGYGYARARRNWNR